MSLPRCRPHLEEALVLARTARFDFALLDINLNGRHSFPVVDAIRARGLPFLFATGYGSRALVVPYTDAPILQKPFNLDELRRALVRLGV
jgi:DNA-binding response OmpR family regulator